MTQTIDDLITLVAKDDLPRLYVQIIDEETDLPLDLSGVTVVTGRFRERNTDETLFSAVLDKLTDGSDGVVIWDWPAAALDLEAGRYEGELSINFGGEHQTLPEKLKFRLIERFAEVA